jgi:hypothetical protein
MYHRLRMVDLMISAEVAVRQRPHLSMVRTFLEYRRVKRGTRVFRETTDYVDKEETAENRIVPDAAFIIENIDTKRRGLFFVEMDMAMERIVSHIMRATPTQFNSTSLIFCCWGSSNQAASIGAKMSPTDPFSFYPYHPRNL